jgi:hypothetical protein
MNLLIALLFVNVQKKLAVVLEKGSGTSSVEEEESTRTA